MPAVSKAIQRNRVLAPTVHAVTVAGCDFIFGVGGAGGNEQISVVLSPEYLGSN